MGIIAVPTASQPHPLQNCRVLGESQYIGSGVLPLHLLSFASSWCKIIWKPLYQTSPNCRDLPEKCSN